MSVCGIWIRRSEEGEINQDKEDKDSHLLRHARIAAFEDIQGFQRAVRSVWSTKMNAEEHGVLGSGEPIVYSCALYVVAIAGVRDSHQ